MSKLLSLVVLFGLITISYSTEAHNPEVQIKAAKASKSPGKVIYQSFCHTCHAEKPLIPLGAPRIHHLKDWQTRSKSGLKSMLKNLAQGLNNMPARGGCFECDDNLLRQATLYMLPEALSKKLVKEDK